MSRCWKPITGSASKTSCRNASETFAFESQIIAMGARGNLEVRGVDGKAQWREFFAIKDRLYRGDPNYVRPLTFQRLTQLGLRPNPFYEHAERRPWICWDGDRAVGRIVAIVDHLHQRHYADRVGFFGFFECVDDREVAQRLLDAAAQWLAERGCDVVRGPVNPSMKSDFGVLVEGNDYPPYFMMAHTPRRYHQLLLDCGLHIVRTFYAYALHSSDDRQAYLQRWRDYEARCQRIRDRFPRFTVRWLSSTHLDRDIRQINELGDQVRSTGWGFVPFTPSELNQAVKQLKRILRPEMNYVAEVDDRIIGYIMAMPDLNWALQKSFGRWDWIRMLQVPALLNRTDRCRIFGFGVAPKYRHSGLAGLLVKRLFDDWGEQYRAWELSWVDSENLRSVRSVQGFIPVEVYKEYHVYERPI